MYRLEDFDRPMDAIIEFEWQLSIYTGAPYVVTVDRCSHAMEIAFRLAHDGSPVSFPSKTYLSVPMTLHKVGVEYTLNDEEWQGGYQFKGSNIWDMARTFERDMYREGSDQIYCLSFGMTKPLQIGLGGAILTDNKEFAHRAGCMRYDGRDIRRQGHWAEQETFELGYHYYMRPEECIKGLNLLKEENFTEQLEKYYNYPDLRKLTIKTSTS